MSRAQRKETNSQRGEIIRRRILWIFERVPNPSIAFIHVAIGADESATRKHLQILVNQRRLIKERDDTNWNLRFTLAPKPRRVASVFDLGMC